MDSKLVTGEAMLTLMLEQYALPSFKQALALATALVDLHITQIANPLVGVHAFLAHNALSASRENSLIIVQRTEDTVKNLQDWQQNRAMWIRVLVETTGEELDTWNKRVGEQGLSDETSLRAWLRLSIVLCKSGGLPPV